MSEKRFIWKTEKLQHSDDEVLLVVDNANKDWKGHILNIVDLLNEQESTIIKQKEEIKKLKKTERSWRRIHCCNKESDNCGIVIEQQEMIDQLEKENTNLIELAEELGVKIVVVDDE